jgi:hypothetical protein
VPEILERVSRTEIEPFRNTAFPGRRSEWRLRRSWNPRVAPDLMPIGPFDVAPKHRERNRYPKLDD